MPQRDFVEFAIALPDGRVVQGRERQVEAKVEAHFRSQLEPVLQAELSFLRRVCELTDTQRQHIAAASEKCCQASAQYLARRQRAKRQAAGNSNIGAQRSAIQACLLRALKEIVPAEHAQRYAQEIGSRQQLRREVALHGLVAKMDVTDCSGRTSLATEVTRGRHLSRRTSHPEPVQGC